MPRGGGAASVRVSGTGVSRVPAPPETEKLLSRRPTHPRDGARDAGSLPEADDSALCLPEVAEAMEGQEWVFTPC